MESIEAWKIRMVFVAFFFSLLLVFKAKQQQCYSVGLVGTYQLD